MCGIRSTQLTHGRRSRRRARPPSTICQRRIARTTTCRRRPRQWRVRLHRSIRPTPGESRTAPIGGTPTRDHSTAPSDPPSGPDPLSNRCPAADYPPRLLSAGSYGSSADDDLPLRAASAPVTTSPMSTEATPNCTASVVYDRFEDATATPLYRHSMSSRTAASSTSRATAASARSTDSSTVCA